jgi:hypothetical protein
MLNPRLASSTLYATSFAWGVHQDRVIAFLNIRAAFHLGRGFFVAARGPP